MVDAAMSFRNQSSEEATRTGTPGPASTRMLADLAAYKSLAGKGAHAPAQSPLWVEHWLASTAADGFVAFLGTTGRPTLGLALEVVRSGPFRVARLMGGRHANGNFPVADPDYLRSGQFRADTLLDAIRSARPDVDALVLERLLPELDGVANPLLALPHVPSPNLALAVDLSGGFEALLSRVSGKRKRKKHRYQARKFESAGGFRRIEAQTAEEATRLIDDFFVMRENRFRKMGITGVFEDAGVQHFFRSLFCDALRQTPPPFVLHALEVDEKLRAVTGSSVSGTRLICEFAAIADDDLAHASPGDYLFFDNIAQACSDGFGVYDFSVGDEPYKRLWCDLETRQFDVVAPLTLKGHLLARRLRLEARVKSYIKNNPTIWRLAKMVRKKAAGEQQAADEE
ncbi:MAG: GNAT family N-acetyltransferase [Hyphomicrobiales bacterium]|nr:GNAT family N-acetyltransferase [Hyphomicrobiales bacterium]